VAPNVRWRLEPSRSWASWVYSQLLGCQKASEKGKTMKMKGKHSRLLFRKRWSDAQGCWRRSDGVCSRRESPATVYSAWFFWKGLSGASPIEMVFLVNLNENIKGLSLLISLTFRSLKSLPASFYRSRGLKRISANLFLPPGDNFLLMSIRSSGSLIICKGLRFLLKSPRIPGHFRCAFIPQAGNPTPLSNQAVQPTAPGI
jgi:hypothetical protein